MWRCLAGQLPEYRHHYRRVLNGDINTEESTLTGKAHYSIRQRRIDSTPHLMSNRFIQSRGANNSVRKQRALPLLLI